jgi:hypothetical protein
MHSASMTKFKEHVNFFTQKATVKRPKCVAIVELFLLQSNMPDSIQFNHAVLLKRGRPLLSLAGSNSHLLSEQTRLFFFSRLAKRDQKTLYKSRFPRPNLLFFSFLFSSALFAYWLRSSVVSVLFSLISEILRQEKH